MSDFQIIKNAPMPSRCASRNAYPFREMEIGDAFDVPFSLKDKVSASASYFGTRYGKKFSVRKIDAETLRVFRTA